MTDATPMPPVVSRSEWERAGAELLLREKELTRLAGRPQQPPYEWMRLHDSY